MKLSEYSLKYLAQAVCGNASYTPYMTGNNLVLFFNKYGFNDIYEQGFPSREKYTEDKLRELNGDDKIRLIIEEIVDPRRYYNLGLTVEEAVKQINGFLKYDKYTLIEDSGYYKIRNENGNLVDAKTSKSINHDFISEQINKCVRKIEGEDYNGAITNARSLVEAIFIEIIERNELTEFKNDGDFDNLWKKVKKVMKLEINKETMPDYVIQILSGLDTSVKGLAGLSNNAADRHANKFRTRKHHAKLAVNLAMTLSDFLLDSLEYQNNKN